MKSSSTLNYPVRIVGGVLAAVFACIPISPSIAGVSGDAFGIYADAPGAHSMTLTGPPGFAVEVNATTYRPPSGEPLPDGAYRYQIYGPMPRREQPYSAKYEMDNGRGEAVSSSRSEASGVIDSGRFRIVNGAVIAPDDAVEESGDLPRE